MTSAVDGHRAGRVTAKLVTAKLVTATLLSGALLFLAACGGGGGSQKDFKTVEEDLGFERGGHRCCARPRPEPRPGSAWGGSRIRRVHRGTRNHPGADLSDEEYEKQYGYGITTLYDKSDVAGANKTYRDSLGPTEQATYDHGALRRRPHCDVRRRSRQRRLHPRRRLHEGGDRARSSAAPR